MVTETIKLIWMMLKFAFVAWAFSMLARHVEASDSHPDSGLVHRICVDVIEINHVYSTDSNGVVRKRLDQAILRNMVVGPRRYDSEGNLVSAGPYFEIDGWVMLYGCRDYSNDEAYRRWSIARDSLVASLQKQDVFVRASSFKWDGEFVCPVRRIGSVYRLRLHDDDGVVTEITAHRFFESHTLEDVERKERSRFHRRKFTLNNLENFPTVVGENSKKRD